MNRKAVERERERLMRDDDMAPDLADETAFVIVRARKGGQARAKTLSATRRSAIARQAARARWEVRA